MSLRRPSLPGILYLLLTAIFPVAGLAYFVAPKVCWAWNQFVCVVSHPVACACALVPVLVLPLTFVANMVNIGVCVLTTGFLARCPLQYTLYHTFGYAYGKSTYLAWKAVGGGLMTVLPAITYTLKVLWWAGRCVLVKHGICLGSLLGLGIICH